MFFTPLATRTRSTRTQSTSTQSTSTQYTSGKSSRPTRNSIKSEQVHSKKVKSEKVKAVERNVEQKSYFEVARTLRNQWNVEQKRVRKSPTLYNPVYVPAPRLEKFETYNQDRDGDFKDYMNSKFVYCLGKDPSPNDKMKIFVLDGPQAGTCHALKKAGVKTRNIFIANDVPSTCTSIASQFPAKERPHIFQGRMLAHLKSTKQMFNHVYMDACGRLDSKEMLATLTELFTNHLAGISPSLGDKRNAKAFCYFEATFYLGREKTEFSQLRNNNPHPRDEVGITEIAYISAELRSHIDHCGLKASVLLFAPSGPMIAALVRLQANI